MRRPSRSLGLERAAAAARLDGVRIVELEAAGFETFVEVDRRAVQVERAFLIDHDRHAVGAIALDPTLTLPRLVRELDAAGVPLLDASLRPPTLDDVFLRLTGGAPADLRDRRDLEERAA